MEGRDTTGFTKKLVKCWEGKTQDIKRIARMARQLGGKREEDTPDQKGMKKRDPRTIKKDCYGGGKFEAETSEGGQQGQEAAMALILNQERIPT